jgi:hypothetical protein
MKKRCKRMGQKRRTTESVGGSFNSKGGGRAKQVAKKIRIDGEVGLDSSKGQFRGEKDGGMDAPLKGERITPCRRVVVMDTVPAPSPFELKLVFPSGIQRTSVDKYEAVMHMAGAVLHRLVFGTHNLEFVWYIMFCVPG